MRWSSYFLYMNSTRRIRAKGTPKGQGVKGETGALQVMRVGMRLGLNLDLALLENEVLADHPPPYILHIVDNGLEVRCSIVRARDEDAVGVAGGGRGPKRV